MTSWVGSTLQTAALLEAGLLKAAPATVRLAMSRASSEPGVLRGVAGAAEVGTVVAANC